MSNEQTYLSDDVTIRPWLINNKPQIIDLDDSTIKPQLKQVNYDPSIEHKRINEDLSVESVRGEFVTLSVDDVTVNAQNDVVEDYIVVVQSQTHVVQNQNDDNAVRRGNAYVS